MLQFHPPKKVYGGRWAGVICILIKFSVAKATLESQTSVCLSVRPSQKPLSLSELLLSAIEPIDHRANQPLSLSTIQPINHRAY